MSDDQLPFVRALTADHPDLDVRVLGSRSTLEGLRGRLGDRWLLEQQMAASVAGRESWTLPGVCQACDRPAALIGDWQLSDGRTPNFRERLACPHCGLNNRQRFMAHLVRTALAGARAPARIHLYEQVTPFFAWARAELPSELSGSEYLGHDLPGGRVIDGVRHEDALDLSFEDASLDLLVSNDVFEHVPDLDLALSECARVLRPGGRLLFSIPFYDRADTSVARARLNEGRVIELLPAEYHGNPVSDKGSLVFSDIGWDVLPRSLASGFGTAYVLGYYSLLYGYLGGGLQLQFVAER